MGLTARLHRYAFTRPHFLLAVAPGATGIRLAVERTARERGWRAAGSPADADVLVVCGEPDQPFGRAVERVWGQMPRPRSRTVIVSPDAVPASLTGAAERLLIDAAGAPGAQHPGATGNLPMADRATDRDGLRLDVLHIAFGPVLANWPAGLTLSMDVQGDVVQRARVTGYVPAREPDAPPGGAAGRRATAAAHADGLAGLLDLVGLAGPAAHCRELRDALLTGTDATKAAARFARTTRRLHRSRPLRWMLRWMLRGIGVIDARQSAAPGIGPALTGDVLDRLTRRADAVAAALDRPQHDPDNPDDPVPLDPAVWQMPVGAVPALVTGRELAAVRLIVASLVPGLAPDPPSRAVGR